MISFQSINTDFAPIKDSANWLKNVIASENKISGDIAVVFCDDAYLLKKNIEFLKHNTLTDVITFDYCKGNKINGDILISIDRVKENSKIYNTSFTNELNRVMVHGLLHLLGYRDKTKKDIEEMRKKEDLYLSIK
tara:strand:- start:220 stop:624 length:405 start_codon:yes stop_codon:yes gene_type:complete